jgi:hypothetical protein
MTTTIDVIDHKDQRYPTVGDWRALPDGDVAVCVSRMKDQRYQTLVAIHELIEAVLCAHRGISEERVTAFDEQFEKHRAEALEPLGRRHSAVRRMLKEAEPGDQRHAPYHREHVFATKIERLMAEELGVDWAKYEAAIAAL